MNRPSIAMSAALALSSFTTADLFTPSRRGPTRKRPYASITSNRRGWSRNDDHLVGSWKGDGVKPRETRQMRRAAERKARR